MLKLKEQALSIVKNPYLIACAGLFLFTLTLRILMALDFADSKYFTFTLKVVTGPDQNTFFEWAEAIKEGHFTFRRLAPGQAFYISPFYSILLSLSLIIAHSVKGMLIFQALLSSILIFVFYDIGRTFKKPGIGVLSALVWSFYGVSCFYDSCVIRESLITFLTFLCFWSILTCGENKASVIRWIRVGIILGILSVLRPHPLLFALPLWILFREGFRNVKSNAKPAAIIIGVVILIIAPFALRNALVSHQFVPIARQGADAFWLGNAPDTLGVSYFPTAKSLALREESDNKLPKSIRILIREFIKDPKAYRDLYSRKIKMYFNDYEIAANYSYYVFKELVPVSKITFISFIWIFPLAVIGLLAVNLRVVGYRDLILFLIIISVSSLSIHIQSRYRFPVIPFVIFLSSMGVFKLAEFIRQKKFIHLTAGLLMICSLSLYSLPYPSYGVMNHYGKDGKLILATSKLRDVDYITWIASYFVNTSTEGRPFAKILLDRASAIYGPEFLPKMYKALEQLRT